MRHWRSHFAYPSSDHGGEAGAVVCSRSGGFTCRRLSLVRSHGVGGERHDDGGERVLQPPVHLRQLADRHRQLHPLLHLAGPRRPLPLRRDLLPPPHRPLVRRPPHRRLHRGEAGVPVLDAVLGREEQGGLPVRRQLRGGERDGAEPAAVQEEAPQRRRHHAILPRRPGRLVQEGSRHARLHRTRAEGGDGEVGVHGGRVRRQRLPPPAVPEQDAGVGAPAGAARRPLHRRRRRGARRARRHHRLRPGPLPARLRPAPPLPLPGRRRRRPRPRHGLPPGAQRRPRRPPQRAPPPPRRRAPRRAPGRHHRLRRLLRRGDGARVEPRGERVRRRRRPDRVLRRRRAVQRQLHRALLRPRRDAVRGPVAAHLVGRPAHDGGGVPDHGARRARRPVRRPAHHVQMPRLLASLSQFEICSLLIFEKFDFVACVLFDYVLYTC